MSPRCTGDCEAASHSRPPGRRDGSELRSVQVASFNLLDRKHATVELPASATKNRQDALLPLRPTTARALAPMLTGRGGLEHGAGAAMLRQDLECAGVCYTDPSARVADFHSLRGVCATHALAAGACPKTAQPLLRHASPDMTLSLCAKVRPGEERAAVESLPDILPAQLVRATGTASDNASSNDPESVASSVAFPRRSPEHSVAPGGNSTPPEAPKTRAARVEMVSQEVPSWNQVRELLSELESLRAVCEPPKNRALEPSG